VVHEEALASFRNFSCEYQRAEADRLRLHGVAEALDRFDAWSRCRPWVCASGGGGALMCGQWSSSPPPVEHVSLCKGKTTCDSDRCRGANRTTPQHAHVK
jgi:hypothetical protein